MHRIPCKKYNILKTLHISQYIEDISKKTMNLLHAWYKMLWIQSIEYSLYTIVYEIQYNS